MLKMIFYFVQLFKREKSLLFNFKHVLLIFSANGRNLLCFDYGKIELSATSPPPTLKPHEIESKVSRAALKIEKIFEFLKNRPIGSIFLLKTLFLLMFSGRVFETDSLPIYKYDITQILVIYFNC